MKKEQRYKIIIGILIFIIILQGVFIIKRLKIPHPPAVIKGKIAIVVDDWGYNLNNLSLLDQIKYPLTISVLPNLSYSQAVAKELHQRGFQIILHLPLQPHEKLRLEKNTIMTSMDEATIKNILKQDLSSIVNPAGVSNHMGSRATEDSRTIGIIFGN